MVQFRLVITSEKSRKRLLKEIITDLGFVFTLRAYGPGTYVVDLEGDDEGLEALKVKLTEEGFTFNEI